MALEPAKLSDFMLAGSLGSGATAKVYEATHRATGRPVAIKVMAEAAPSSELRERFAREALLLADVDSRHVSKIVGFGFEKGQPFLVLERLQGETLDAKLRRDGAVPLATAVRWIEQLIVGVRDCHDAKVIHRDIKPSNVFLHHDQENGLSTVKLIDFGVARLREIAGDPGGITSATHVIGSMGYMAPEQFKSAKSVGFPADLYAIGVVIFRTLTGRLPFVSRSPQAVIRMKSEKNVPALSSMPGMAQSPLLDWFVAKATAREPGDRFQSAREMLEQWRSVMASLDDESGRDIGRVDESYAGRRPSADAPNRGAEAPTAPPPPVTTIVTDDERTDRQAPLLLGANAPDRGSSGITELAEEVAPVTIPSLGLLPNLEASAAAAEDEDSEGEDPFGHTTRQDATLRELVEQELELQRRRDRREPE
jgi:serine/threonine protein kinase